MESEREIEREIERERERERETEGERKREIKRERKRKTARKGDDGDDVDETAINAFQLSQMVVETFFKDKDNANNLVAHHLDSCNDFFKTGIAKIFKENNPLCISRTFERESGQKQAKTRKCFLYLGGKNNDKIYFSRPVMRDMHDNNTSFMYPNDARLRNLTYSICIHYDVDVECTNDDDENDDDANEKKRERGEEKEIQTKTISHVFLGNFPVMVQSNLCILQSLSKEVRFQMGECRNDFGGYFIINGKEKVIIPQEKLADNVLHTIKHCDGSGSGSNDAVYSHSVKIRSVSEDTSKPIRKMAVHLVAADLLNRNGQIVVTIPHVNRPIPLFILMRALGVTSDKDIIRYCLLDMQFYDCFVDLFIPSVHDAQVFFNQTTAIEYIASFTNRGTINTVLDILSESFLPHVGGYNDFANKAYFIGYMVLKLLRLSCNWDLPTDRDNFKCKRIELPGMLMYNLFREYYSIQCKNITREIERIANIHNPSLTSDGFNAFMLKIVSTMQPFQKREVEMGFQKAFKGNYWGYSSQTAKKGVVQDLNRQSWNAHISHLRKVNLNLDATATATATANTTSQQLNASQFGYFDPTEIPAPVGQHKFLSICTYITSNAPAKPIIDWLSSSDTKTISTDEMLQPLCDHTPEQLAARTKVFVNGNWIGVVERPIQLLTRIKLQKRNGLLPVFMTAAFHYDMNEICIYTDAGRLKRPLFHISDDNSVGNGNGNSLQSWQNIISGFGEKKDPTFDVKADRVYPTFDALYDISDIDAEKSGGKALAIRDFLKENQAIVEFVDVVEEDSCLIAMKYDDLPANANYTHLEIDPSLIFGVAGNLIVFPEHSAILQNVNSCDQIKQAVSMYHSNFRMRMDKSALVLNYGQTPLVKTKYLQYLNNEEHPYGVNTIVAIMSFTGYNVKGAILINEASVNRGLFSTTCYSTYTASEATVMETGEVSCKFGDMKHDAGLQKTNDSLDYTKLDERGLIFENEPVTDKTVLIGQMKTAAASASAGAGIWTDRSIRGKTGFVDKSFVTNNAEGHNVAKVRIREERTPCMGDTLASRSGQKGTIGLLVAEEDMPFTSEGIRPDVIINPHCIPANMTIGQLLESLFGKVCVHLGAFGDCTAFHMKGSHASLYGSVLRHLGFHPSGNELLCNGMTGDQLSADIFIGPTYYMRLNDLVIDKMHARSRGLNTLLERQPVQEDGVQIDEMDRDAMLAHGLSCFLNESFLARSDEYHVAVCNKTGVVSIYNGSKNVFLSPTVDGPLQFVTNAEGDMHLKTMSTFGRSFSLVRIPYSLKLCIQELQILNVQLRIITDANVNQMQSLSFSNNIRKLRIGEKEKTIIDDNKKRKNKKQRIRSFAKKEEEEAFIGRSGVLPEEEESDNGRSGVLPEEEESYNGRPGVLPEEEEAYNGRPGVLAEEEESYNGRPGVLAKEESYNGRPGVLAEEEAYNGRPGVLPEIIGRPGVLAAHDIAFLHDITKKNH